MLVYIFLCSGELFAARQRPPFLLPAPMVEASETETPEAGVPVRQHPNRRGGGLMTWNAPADQHLAALLQAAHIGRPKKNTEE